MSLGPAKPRPQFVFRQLPLLVVALIVCAAMIDRLRARAVVRLKHVVDNVDVYALPPPPYVKRAALGYDQAVASMLWASTLYQYGERVNKNRRFPFGTEYCDAITHLDPAFRPAYRYLSALVTMQVVSPDRYQLDAARLLLKRGVDELPSDADVWGAYASFLMFDAPPYLAADEKKTWRVEGAAAAQRAVELGFFMSDINIAGAVYLDSAGHRELAIAQLLRAYDFARDDESRDKIALRIQRLKGEAAVERKRRARLLFMEQWQQQAPFLDDTLFSIVGARGDPIGCTGKAGIDARCGASASW